MPKDEKTVEQIAEEINTSIEGLKKSINDKADLSKLDEKFDAITAKLDKLVDKDGKVILPGELTKQQEQLDEISTQLKQLGEHQAGKGKSMSLQVFDKVKSKDFQDKVKAYSGGLGQINAFEVNMPKVAALIDTDDINAGTIETQIEPGVSAAPWRTNPIWDNINKGVIGQGRDSVSWWEETTRIDSADMVTEQQAPTVGSGKTWTKQSLDILMIKDFTKVSKSALEDFEYITSEINDLMNNGIPRYREGQLLSGAGTTYPRGLTYYAKTFAKPANFNLVTAANEGDVLAAAILQCMNGNTADANKKGYVPNVILLNPGDTVNMRLLKNLNASYVHHPLLSPDGSLFNGARIATSLDLAAGQFIVGDFSRAKAYVKRTMRISFHYENENDVLADLVLVLASIRLAGLKVTTADAFAFVTGTFDAGIALIGTD